MAKGYLLDLVGMAVAYIQKQYPQNPQAIYKVFEDALNHLPLMAPSKFSKQEYSYEVGGQNVLINLGSSRQTKPLFILIEIEVMKVGSILDLVPKITAFYYILPSDSKELIHAFLTNKKARVKFEFYSVTSVFNYRAIEKDEVKAKFENLIEKSPKVDVTTWENYHTYTNETK